MKATVEILSGVVRSGPNCERYGDPFDFGVAFIGHGKRAVLKALVHGQQTLTIAHERAAVKALHGYGFERVEWDRLDPQLRRMVMEQSWFRRHVNARPHIHSMICNAVGAVAAYLAMALHLIR